jgi:hypothetical protein
MFDNDATGCFNWIIIAITTITAIRLAFPKLAAQMHTNALLGMRYHIKTAHGLSNQFYKVTRQFLLFGTGQGSGA